MKKTILFSSALVTLTILASCQKEQLCETPATPMGVTEFTATIEQPTKTAIASDGKITWTAGDEITVTDAASKSAVYVAASSGSSTKFNLKAGQTAVGGGPYTATYGDISNQTYSANGANCPLTAAETSTTNFHFSSPYAVVKVTAMSSGGESVKTVVATYGNSNYVLDCGEGVTLTSAGVDFYVAVRPATEAAALSVSFYTADKMAKKARKSNVSLAAKDFLTVTLDSFEWGNKPTFKAVFDTNGDANTLTFYYDAVDHSGTGITVYEYGTANYLFDNAKSNNQKWGYYGKSTSVKSVVINSSVKNYPFLESTTFMFYNMSKATGISGAEYLDVSNVADMSYMFTNFGSNTTNFNIVPYVSGWNTGNVTNMAYMFNSYGKNSTVLDKVPNVKGWDTEIVENMNNMFQFYGNSSTALTEVPDVSSWETGSVTNMSNMFNSYGYSSTVLNAVPIVSSWKTGSVTNMSNMFTSYGNSSTVLTEVPNVSSWETGNVTNMSNIFKSYGKNSTVLTDVPDVSSWKTGSVTNMSYMFDSYGYSSTVLNAVPIVSSWETGNVTDWGEIFQYYGYLSTALTTVPDVSGWKSDKVTDIANMFQYYGNSSDNIVCVLDLSGWDLSNLSQGLNAFDFKPKTFTVTIPAKTDDKTNTTDKWYFGSKAIELSDSIAPALKPGSGTERHSFILK